MDDRELLNCYTETGDQGAFRQLVDRYLGMVHGTALRRLGNRELAEEVSQNVFTLLARKATRLKPDVVIAGWLHRTTVLQSSHTMRTERTRAHKMKAFSETLAVESEEGTHEWNDVVGMLDASMAQLPAKDRDVIFLRFFEGATFQDIGQRLGKSESATLRHANRALEKLSKLLKKKGVTISAAALAAGLHGELAQGAPAALAASISQTALSSTTVIASSGTLTYLIILMTHTKTSTLVLVGCGLVALCTGAGLLVGNLQQPATQASIEESAPTEEPGSAAIVALPVIAEPVSLIESQPSNVVTLLQEAVDVIEKAGSPKSVEDEVRAIVAGLSANDMTEALTFARSVSLSEKETELLTEEIYRHWGSLNGLEAMTEALAITNPEARKGHVRKVINGWSEVDPEAAHTWYQEARASNESPMGDRALQELIGGIAKGWIRHDLDAGFAMVEALPFDEQSHALQEFGDFANVPEIHDAVATKISELADTEVRAEMIRFFGNKWAKVDPRAAVAWVDNFEFADQAAAMKAGMAIGEGLFERHPREAVDWFIKRAPEEVRPDFLKNIVGREWAERDLTAATAWLNENGYNPSDYIQQ